MRPTFPALISHIIRQHKREGLSLQFFLCHVAIIYSFQSYSSCEKSFCSWDEEILNEKTPLISRACLIVFADESKRAMMKNY